MQIITSSHVTDLGVFCWKLDGFLQQNKNMHSQETSEIMQQTLRLRHNKNRSMADDDDFDFDQEK